MKIKEEEEISFRFESVRLPEKPCVTSMAAGYHKSLNSDP